MNYWHLSKSQEDKLVDILQTWFDKLEKMTDEEFANTPSEDINLDFTRIEFAFDGFLSRYHIQYYIHFTNNVKFCHYFFFCVWCFLISDFAK